MSRTRLILSLALGAMFLAISVIPAAATSGVHYGSIDLGHPTSRYWSATEADFAGPFNFCKKKPVTQGYDAYVIDLKDWTARDEIHIKVTNLKLVSTAITVTFYTPDDHPDAKCWPYAYQNAEDGYYSRARVPENHRWAVVSARAGYDLTVQWSNKLIP